MLIDEDLEKMIDILRVVEDALRAALRDADRRLPQSENKIGFELPKLAANG